ncbi:hypothetical protein ACRAKI_10285 [Saccharothrix isguenensis]
MSIAPNRSASPAGSTVRSPDRVFGRAERNNDTPPMTTAAGQARTPVGRQRADRQEDRGHADRQVDEEDPVPAQRVGEHAAQHLPMAAPAAPVKRLQTIYVGLIWCPRGPPISASAAAIRVRST